MTEAQRRSGIIAVATVVLVGGVACGTPPSDEPLADVPIDPVGISGVVLNEDRPEAGVWVVAETDSLPTHFQRIVVTDDQGRFLVPDLPDGDYEVWVRGYGLRDSTRVTAAPGEQLSLTVEDARHPQEAAKIYPANYWLSLYEPPADNTLPLVGNRDDRAGSVALGEGKAEERDEESIQAAGAFPTREHWIGQMKLSCMLCHQMGQEISRVWLEPDHWDAVWERAGMDNSADALGRDALKTSLADWTPRIAAG